MSNQPPKFNSNRKRTFVGKEIEVFEQPMMNDHLYEMIVLHVKAKGLKSKKAVEFFINHLIPGKRIYQEFLLYDKIYKNRKKTEAGQSLLDKLFEIADDMEDYKNSGLRVIKIKKERKKGNKPEKEIDPLYEFYDSKIEEIEILIYLGVSPKRICLELKKEQPLVNPINYERWKDQSEYLDRLDYAFKKSADEHMFASQEFLLDWLDKEKHPELNMQHVGIIREVALWKSRMAGFLNRKKFGNKVEVIDDRPQRKIMDGKDIKSWLEGLDSIAGRTNGENIKDEEEGEREDEFEEEDFEEDNGNIQDAEIVED